MQKSGKPFLKYFRFHSAFTLVEMLMALLIVSLILSASLPVISQRTKAQYLNSSKYNAVPIGMIAIWGSAKALPDNTWLECNGQAIPNGIEYEEIRRIYGAHLPDYRGMFLRGYGSVTHTQNNGSIVGNTATTHSSGAIGTVQGDAIRNIRGALGQDLHFGNEIGVLWNPRDAFAMIYQPTEITIAIYKSVDAAYHTYDILFDASRITPTSTEIRPVNKAVRYIIKVRR